MPTPYLQKLQTQIGDYFRSEMPQVKNFDLREYMPKVDVPSIGRTIKGLIASGVNKVFPEQAIPTPTQAPTAPPSVSQILPTAEAAQSPARRTLIPGFKTWEPPEDLASLIVQAAEKYNIHPGILASILQTESGINPNVGINTSVLENGQVSNDRNLAQISDLFHPEVSDEQAADPEFAINFAAQLLAEYMTQTGNLPQAIAAYNVGPGRVGPGEGRNEQGLGPKGMEYLNKVLSNLDENTIADLLLRGSY